MADAVSRPESRYEFAIKGDGPIFFLTDSELALSDEGVSYALKGRSGLRAFSGLTSVRLQLLSPRPWMAVAELQFMRRPSLFVYSKVQAGGTQERSQAFAAFVRDLHQRLSADDKKRIVFRRGISPARHLVLIGGVAVFAVSLIFLLGAAVGGHLSFGEMIGPAVGCAVLTAGFGGQIAMLRPGTYDPDNLPRDSLGPFA
jgi:hypothetical protein